MPTVIDPVQIAAPQCFPRGYDPAMDERCDIAIVGAGAAGMTAGIFAAETLAAAGSTARRVLLLDGAPRPGAKILVSGGGRCNVTHDHITTDDYFAPRTIVRNVLAAFDEQKTVAWMRSLGVPLKTEETGKLFPVSDSARTVLDALLGRLQGLNVEIRPATRVTNIRREADELAFRVEHAGGAIIARAVIFCTGGRSLPRTGSDGAGWSIVRRLGHSVSDTWPALVPLVLDETMFHAEVSGLSHEVELSTFVDFKRIDRRSGSLLWTHFGISGPVVMDASRFWTIAHGRGQTVEMRCHVLPGETFETAERWLLSASAARPRTSIAKVVAERLPERLAFALVRRAGADPAQPAGQLTRDARRALVHTLTAMPLPIIRDRGWNYAEVTAGGVPLEEIDFRTMMSRKTPGLYLAGEILDCDGRIGGFNFQWAWATGFLAGRAAAKQLCTA